ncbi:tyrosine-protein phosphatase 10D-like isoform X2 [Argonauta hians]
MLRSGVTYAVTVGSISLGVRSLTSFHFKISTAPDKVLDIKCEEKNCTIYCQWKPPLNTNTLQYTVSYKEFCLPKTERESSYNVTNNSTSIKPIKPGCRYEICIWAWTSEEGRQNCNPNITTKTFRPPFNKDQHKMNLSSISTDSVKIVLKENPFSDKNGPIVDYNIIVATNKDDKYTNQRILPSWREFTKNNSIKAYQLFKNCSSLYKVSNSCSGSKQKQKRSLNQPVEHNIGTVDCSKTSQQYCNGHLKANTEYYIKIRAFTFDDYSDTSYSGPIRTKPVPVEGLADYVIAIICILVLLVLALAIVVVYLRRRNYKKPTPFASTGNPYVMQPTSHPVKSIDFETHLNQMSADSEYQFAEEFESLKEVGVNNSSEAAHLNYNRPKNRFVNILPFDFSRVKLSSSDDDVDNGSDYINANYIAGFKARREYIAAQGPLRATRDDFWRMVWEQNVHNIVMLANCIENQRQKCDHYWPETEEPRVYGNIRVERLNETITADWTISEFLVSYKKQSRHLLHFHFTSWPDFGVPSSPQSLVIFVRLVRKKLKNIGPIVVHCSAGVGRTGTYIAVDHSLQDLEENKEVDILRVVRDLRGFRCQMVQTEGQYIFIHRCILFAIKQQGENDIYANTLYMNEDFVNNGHVNRAFLYDC